MNPEHNALIIARWTMDDLPVFRRILRETWHDAYGGFIAPGDLDWYLDATYSLEKLGGLFRSARVDGYLARMDGDPAGLMRTEDRPEQRRLYVSSLYVLPRYQGAGIGGALLDLAERDARGKGAESLWLGVMVDNIRALEWYRSRGFSFVEREPFHMGTSKADHLIGFRPVGS